MSPLSASPAGPTRAASHGAHHGRRGLPVPSLLLLSLCQQGFAPLDDALQLSERRTPWDLQQAAARLAAEVPFETAQELFTQLTGLSLSDHTIHAVAGELSHELGVLEVSPTAAEMAQRVAEMAAGKTWRPIMVLAIDGAFVPTRPAQAKEAGDGPPAHAGQAGRVAGGMEGGQGLSLLPGGSGADGAMC